MPNMDYSLVHRTPDGTGKILVTTPGSPNKGSYVLESDMKIYTNQGMVAIADIVDDLVTADATKPLSANQGVVLKQLIDAVSGGITPKGDILSFNLPPADDTNKGWQYYCTDINKWATSDGTQWIMTSNSIIVQTPDATDTGHALSNAVVTQCCNEVKGKLNQHDSRLENLEQKAGDYTTVQYRGTDAVPTGKAKYGLVEKIVGKTRAWNQLVKNGNFADSSNWNSSSLGSLSVSGNKAILTATDTSNDVAIRQYLSLLQGHKYLISFYMTPKNCDGYTRVSWNGINISSPMATTKDVKTNYSFIYEVEQTATSYCRFFLNRNGNVVGDVAEFENINCYDITLIFGSGNEPSTVAEALALLPALGQYNAYDAGSLVSTEVSGVKSVGVNIWDEEWELGGISSTSGDNSSDSTRIRSKNYIPLDLGVEYYCKSVNTVGARYYDSSKNFISSGNIANKNFTPPSNAFYLRFVVLDCTSYANDIQICLNSYADKTTYHPYKTNTLSLSETVTLRSGGSVVDVLDVESGIASRNIKQICLNVGSEMITSFTNIAYLKVSVSDSANLSVSGGNFTSTLPLGRTSGTYDDAKYIGTICRAEQHAFYVGFAVGTTLAQAQTAMANHYVNYEIATPITESIDPIIDNFIEVEGGGTIDTIQEQSPIIDNSLDVGYLTL